MAITVKEAREVLGISGEKMSDLEIENLLALFDSLSQSILDQYQRSIFKGKTIKELVRDM